MAQKGKAKAVTIPSELSLLGIRKRTLFPGVLLRLTIGRPKSVRLVQEFWDARNRTFKKGSLIFVCTVKNESVGEKEVKPGSKLSIFEESKIDTGDETVVNAIEIPDGEKNVVYEVGTVARILQLSRVNNTNKQEFQFSMLVEGVQRARAAELVKVDPYCVARIELLPDIGSENDTNIRALAMNIKKTAKELLELQKNSASGNASSQIAAKTKEAIARLEQSPPGKLADMLSASLDASVEEKQQILCEVDLNKRLHRALELLNRQVEVLRISGKIQSQVEGKLKTSQREYYLRQQLKAINEELGQLNGGNGQEKDEIETLEEALEAAVLPEEVKTITDRDLNRLKSMQPSQPEYTVIRTYLEWISDLPWGKSTKDNLDVKTARAQLDSDHHALDKVKKRIVEFLAVRSLQRGNRKGAGAGPILCLVGPPGVGKTSLGKSVAKAIGRNFERMALGGVRDEAEIRGHRRTYIGAMPGTVIQSLKKAGSNNPVLLLDEVDKLGRDMRQGDPGSALLEVLDPEQNSTFTDHYLNVPFDLSKTLFIATANTLETIPGPLLDRMEVIQLPGYTFAEKAEIAKRHLVPKQMERHSINQDHVVFTPKAIDLVISGYTREAGVRNLDREIASLCRYAAVKVAESRDLVNEKKLQELDDGIGVGSVVVSSSDDIVEESSDEVNPLGNSLEADDSDDIPLILDDSFECVVVDEDVVKKVLGPVKFESELAQRTAVPGVATGMAWTRVGGEILFVEASLHRGSGRLQLTGQLGSVMEESVRTALSFVRSNIDALGLNQFDGKDYDLQEAIGRADLHVHFPAGAVPKDGPSAGVAVTAAIVSALSGVCVRPDTSCTGEITLRGLVLPVGGIKEKVLAAHRAGVKRIVLPERNKKDVLDIPEDVRNQLEIVHVKHILEAMDELFEKKPRDAEAPMWLMDLPEGKKERDSFSKKGNAGGGIIPPANPQSPSNPALAKPVDLCGPILASVL
mmetsp:Transcript_9024/g.10320  ORF Transcript_9024/g.10320 Transcript_9024/m.10320 type:complete len:975 (-) Transcript_9024:56-2980(-)